MEEILIPLMVFGFIIAMASMKHRHKLDEMRVLRGEGIGASGDVMAEIRKLQEQIHELRDTTTRYDMSFDAALQRLESRVSHVESQQRELTSQAGVAQIPSGH